MFLRTNHIYWVLLPKKRGTFADLFNVVDNTKKAGVAKGLGVTKSSSPITSTMESEMWQSGVLGEHSPMQLIETILFLIGINFCLRSGAEHKKIPQTWT